MPSVEDLPARPEAWVTGLAKDSVREEFFDGSAPNRPWEEDVAWMRRSMHGSHS